MDDDRNIFFRVNGVLQKIISKEIIFLETAGNYVKVHVPGAVHLVHTTLEFALRQLPQHLFVQIHRCYVVSVDHLSHVGRDFVSLLSPRIDLPLSKKFYDNLVTRLRIIGSFLVLWGLKIDLFGKNLFPVIQRLP